MKPKTKDEAHLRRKYELEDQLPHAEKRGIREDKRVWKRQLSKANRSAGKQQIREVLDGDNE